VLKRFIFWDYARMSWQYDVIVGLILAFIFLTPRGWFRDQPRIATASSITPIPSEKGSSVFFVNTEMLSGVPEDQQGARLTQVLRVRASNPRLQVTRIEPVLDSEGGLQGYMAFARP
jgi:hypothetical protein